MLTLRHIMINLMMGIIDDTGNETICQQQWLFTIRVCECCVEHIAVSDAGLLWSNLANGYNVVYFN